MTFGKSKTNFLGKTISKITFRPKTIEKEGKPWKRRYSSIIARIELSNNRIIKFESSFGEVEHGHPYIRLEYGNTRP